jgi:sugar lactone lactonase YvrE
MTRTLRARWRFPLVVLAVAVTGLTLASAAGAAPTVTFQKSYGFSGPAGLYAYGMEWDASDNTILVGDYWNYRVQRFSATGTHLATYLDVTGPKANGGIASAPYDIASDPTDPVGGGSSFWAADQGSSNFAEFSHSGAWLQTIGSQQSTVTGTDAGHPGHSYAFGCGNGQMNVPTHIMVDTVASNHFLYVSDPACRNVYIFNHQGAFQGQLDWTGSGVGTPIPRGLAEDAAGNIYVAEYNSRRIFVFNSTTRKIIASSAVRSDLRDVRGIALDPTRDLIYAVGAALNRVYEYSYDPATIASGTGAGSTVVRFVNEWRNTDGTNYALKHQAFDSIRFVAVDGSGNVYTGDTWGCPAYASQCVSTTPVQDPGYRVLKFSPNDWTAKPSCNPGNATAQTTCAGAAPLSWSAGTEPPPQGGFNQQNGIAVVPHDSEATGGADGLYVVDTFEQRVQKFDTNQTCSSAGTCPGWIRQWGGRAPSNPNNEGFGYPRALTYEADGHHYIWVGDNNNDVMAFTQQGGFVHRFGSQGKSPGMFSGGAQGIRVQGGRVYATDVAGCRLQVFDEAQLLSVPSGTSALEDVVGGCGTTGKLMTAPRGIAVDPTDPSIVYVANTGNGVITKWQLNLGAPGSFNGGGTATQIKPSCDGKALAQPWGITYEDGWYYIGDVKNDRVVRWQPGTGIGTCQTVVNGNSGGAGFFQAGMVGANFVEFGADPSTGVHRMYISDNSRHIFSFNVTG